MLSQAAKAYEDKIRKPGLASRSGMALSHAGSSGWQGRQDVGYAALGLLLRFEPLRDLQEPLLGRLPDGLGRVVTRELAEQRIREVVVVRVLREEREDAVVQL